MEEYELLENVTRRVVPRWHTHMEELKQTPESTEGEANDVMHALQPQKPRGSFRESLRLSLGNNMR